MELSDGEVSPDGRAPQHPPLAKEDEPASKEHEPTDCSPLLPTRPDTRRPSILNSQPQSATELDRTCKALDGIYFLKGLAFVAISIPGIILLCTERGAFWADHPITRDFLGFAMSALLVNLTYPNRRRTQWDHPIDVEAQQEEKLLEQFENSVERLWRLLYSLFWGLNIALYMYVLA
ncbi:hypothetical protein MMC20_006560 [Loxospora ochrophaea]|nr:hypothetical protein [Loxospora ochrophaea]